MFNELKFQPSPRFISVNTGPATLTSKFAATGKLVPEPAKSREARVEFTAVVCDSERRWDQSLHGCIGGACVEGKARS